MKCKFIEVGDRHIEGEIRDAENNNLIGRLYHNSSCHFRRFGRMIEKMEEMLVLLEKSRIANKDLIFLHNDIVELLSYVNHGLKGKKEEMVKIAICGKNTIFVDVKGGDNVRFFDIPKSEAVKLGLIKEF